MRILVLINQQTFVFEIRDLSKVSGVLRIATWNKVLPPLQVHFANCLLNMSTWVLAAYQREEWEVSKKRDAFILIKMSSHSSQSKPSFAPTTYKLAAFH